METFEAVKTKYSGLSEQEFLEVIAKLLFENGLLKAMLYSSSSERRKVDTTGMKSLFDEAEAEAETETEDSNVPTEEANDLEANGDEDKEGKGSPKGKRGRGKRAPLPAELPRVRQEFDLPESDKICPIHNVPLVKVGEEITEKLEIIPAKVQVVQQVTFVYKPVCCDGAFASSQSDPDPIPKSFATPSLLAYIATAKFQDGLPLYRQEKIFERFAIGLDRTTMARWMIAGGELVMPLINLMREDVLGSKVIHMDETEVQILKEEGRAAEAKSYMWCMARQIGPPIILFSYYQHRNKNAALDLLQDFDGTLVCDGYKVYNSIQALTGIDIAGCLAHVRRKFFQAEKCAKKEAQKSTEITASKALDFIRAIYKIESRIKGQLPEAILAARTVESLPIMESFHEWLIKMEKSILPSSPTGKAISYTLGQWPKLMVFTQNGLVPVDNNYMEGHIRPFVIGRNAWLFADSPKGAAASANLYSLVETAKANGIQPYDYLCLIFKELPKSPTLTELEKLLPYRAKEFFKLNTYQIKN